MSSTLKTSLTERDMLDRLNIRYGKTYRNGNTEMQRYTRAEHVRSSLGFNARRTADYIAMDLWGATYGSAETRGPFLHGHEVKVSRSDFLTELKDPEKAEEFKRYMHYWWLCVSDKNIVREGELPAGWGLLIAHGATLRIAVPAPKLTPEPMPMTAYGALLRATQKTATQLACRA